MMIGGGGGGQVVKVKRDILEACMTCPLCKKLLRDATTISLCLHTFCRKCIYEKLSDEEVDCCPVCDIDLGCLPVEKLRADHNLQDIRAKIFPFKRRKIQAPEVVMPSITLPVKRKERSLSSLVVSTPKMPIPTSFTGRRSKAGARKAAALRRNFSLEETNNKLEEDSSAEDSPTQKNKRQFIKDSSSVDVKHVKEESEDEVEIIKGKADLWTPLNCLVEAANRSKSSKLNSQGISLSKSQLLLSSPDTEFQLSGTNYIPKSKHKELGEDMKPRDEKNLVKRRRLTSRKRAAMAQEEELTISAQVMVDASSGAKNNRRDCPIWFSLVACEDQKGDASLPQISACYLRIKDGKMPVSFIQKYLMKKLDLNSEAEVEIMCQGRPVLPTQQLRNLADLFRTASMSKKVAVGSSAKDFVMVLSYCRKV